MSRPLRAGINAQIVSFASSYRQAGVSRFTEQVVRGLQQRDSTANFSVFVNDTARGGFRDSANMRFQIARLPTAKPAVRILWEQLVLPALCRDLDMLHCPVNVVPLAATCPTLLTVHDLTFMRYPQAFRRERRAYLAALTRLSARRAKRITTDSANTKSDLNELFAVPENKIEVVYPGVGELSRPPSATDVAALRQRHGLPEQFILSVGTLEPRKNLDLLIRAYGLLLKRRPDACPLVIGGGQGWMFEQIYVAVEENNLKGRVHFPGYLALEELPTWYGAATAFVYPSLYEGFGLPPLEAMACGTPVVVANTSSLPEVVGDAGVRVDPHDAEQLAVVLEELLQSNQRREQMSAAGLRQAATFTWERTVDQMSRLYRETSRMAA